MRAWRPYRSCAFKRTALLFSCTPLSSGYKIEKGLFDPALYREHRVRSPELGGVTRVRLASVLVTRVRRPLTRACALQSNSFQSTTCQRRKNPAMSRGPGASLLRRHCATSPVGGSGRSICAVERRSLLSLTRCTQGTVSFSKSLATPFPGCLGAARCSVLGGLTLPRLL